MQAGFSPCGCVVQIRASNCNRLWRKLYAVFSGWNVSLSKKKKKKEKNLKNSDSLAIIFTLSEKKGTQRDTNWLVYRTLNKLMPKLAMINACLKCGYYVFHYINWLQNYNKCSLLILPSLWLENDLRRLSSVWNLIPLLLTGRRSRQPPNPAQTVQILLLLLFNVLYLILPFCANMAYQDKLFPVLLPLDQEFLRMQIQDVRHKKWK